MVSIHDNYEINVAKNGKHYCRIELPHTFEKDAIQKLQELERMFGSDYELELTYWECRGHRYNRKED